MESLLREHSISGKIKIPNDEAVDSGGFGKLYIGNHPVHGRVALKHVSIPGSLKEQQSSKVQEQTLKLVLAEVNAWKSLDHPHVLPFLGVYIKKMCVYMVSPWAEGGCLVQYLEQNPAAERTRFIRETADALNYLHEQNIIHGDVKGPNILLSQHTQVLLCDFGMSRSVSDKTQSQLQGGGSNRWIAPEIWQGERKTFESDVFSFGMTIYQVLSGKVPLYDYLHDWTVPYAFTQGKRPPKEPERSPSDKSYEPIWEVAERCWKAKPEARPTMAKAFSDLSELCEPSVSPATITEVKQVHQSRSGDLPKLGLTGMLSSISRVLTLPWSPPPNLYYGSKATSFNHNNMRHRIRLRLIARIEADPHLMFVVEVNPEGQIQSVTMSSLVPRCYGGSGEIFTGTADTGMTVAVKRLRIGADGYTVDQAEHMQLEAAVWRQLDHPNVLQFLGTILFGGNLSLISPWMNNGSLRDYLPKHPDADRPQFLLETANALVYLHSREIIHGDVKAANILVSSDTPPRALMCDFGFSRPTVIPTAKGLKGAGTVKWQAPELWDNQPKSFRSDVFSFGITIFEVLSGNEPYCDCSPATLLVQIAMKGKRPPKEPLQCPRTGNDWRYLWDVAEKCWKTEPTERPEMGSVHRWLEMKKMDGEEEGH